jgi:hypothetical protein
MPEDYGPEDFLQWYRSPLTQAFISSLDEDRGEIMRAWSRQQFIGENGDQTLHLNGQALAQVKTLDEIITNLEESAESAAHSITEKGKKA